MSSAPWSRPHDSTTRSHGVRGPPNTFTTGLTPQGAPRRPDLRTMLGTPAIALCDTRTSRALAWDGHGPTTETSAAARRRGARPGAYRGPRHPRGGLRDPDIAPSGGYPGTDHPDERVVAALAAYGPNALRRLRKGDRGGWVVGCHTGRAWADLGHQRSWVLEAEPGEHSGPRSACTSSTTPLDTTIALASVGAPTPTGPASSCLSSPTSPATRSVAAEHSRPWLRNWATSSTTWRWNRPGFGDRVCRSRSWWRPRC